MCFILYFVYDFNNNNNNNEDYLLICVWQCHSVSATLHVYV